MRVTEKEVLEVQEPEFTETWHPASHKKIIDALNVAVIQHEITISKKSYWMTKDSQRMFGVWNLDTVTDGIQEVIGFRNSIDKSLSVGITAGSHVIVCENLAFSGEYITFRRHTRGIDPGELNWLAIEAMDTVSLSIRDFISWQQQLKLVNLSTLEMKALVFDALPVIIKFSEIRLIKVLLFEAKKYPLTLFGFQNAVTETLKGQDLSGTATNRHGLLTKLLKDQCSAYEKRDQIAFRR